ncbi:MAG: transcriptional regulator [Thermodesulfobacteriota bacterium]
MRQTIINLLEQAKHSARDLADILLLTQSEVESHLAHVQRSLKKRLQVSPAQCRDCGYVFRGRARLDTPGRCPRCRGQRVEGPWFRVSPSERGREED